MRDGFEPAGEGFGGTNVGSERGSEWAEHGHRVLRVVVERRNSGEGLGKWVGWDSSVGAFRFVRLAFLPARKRSGLFVPVWM